MLDEVHERGAATDLLLGLLKKILRRRKGTLRVVVASATVGGGQGLDTMAIWCSDGEGGLRAAVLSLEGRAHPVEVAYLAEPCANYVARAAQVAMDIHRYEEPGDVLVFMPGMEMTLNLCGEMGSDDDDNDEAGTWQRMNWYFQAYGGSSLPAMVFKLYSALPPHMQTFALKPARRGVRKVVVATAIAETSVTLPGVVYVVDPGLQRLPWRDPRRGGLQALLTGPAPQASAVQRAGRAGRVRPGKCFRLYTEDFFHRRLAAQGVPELQRGCGLTTSVLLLAALGVRDAARFEWPAPPGARALADALEQLYSLGAIDDDCILTKPVGELMAEMPTEPMIAKALISSYDFECTEEMLTIAAMVSVQNIFIHPKNSKDLREKLEEAMGQFAVREGDHVTYLNVYEDYAGGGGDPEWCAEYCVNRPALAKAVHIRAQLKRYLEMLCKEKSIQSCQGDIQKIQKALVAGFFSQAARIGPDGKYRTVRNGTEVTIHPSSVFAKFGAPAEHIIFHEAVFTDQVG
ncbi:unnamed protein product [Heterosigma akashiwo]